MSANTASAACPCIHVYKNNQRKRTEKKTPAENPIRASRTATSVLNKPRPIPLPVFVLVYPIRDSGCPTATLNYLPKYSAPPCFLKAPL